MPKKTKPKKAVVINHGVIPGQKKSDFASGRIPYRVVVPSGNWTPFLVRGERQYFPKFDTMACVSFAGNTICEMQIKQQTGVEVNFSDRFLAKMSGTTRQGNWLYLVDDTLRLVGGVLEEEWPVLPANATWDDYYVNIPQFVIDRAKKQFRDRYSVAYETMTTITGDEIQKQLKHAPLQVVIPGHCVAGIILSANEKTITYFDSYDPYIKTIGIDKIQSIYKIVLTVKGILMEILQVAGEDTLVVKNGAGKFYEIATSPDLFPLVARILGLDPAAGAKPNTIARADVNANLSGQAKPVLAFIEK